MEGKKKKVAYTSVLTKEDYLDVMLIISGRKIIKFSLNYRTLIQGKWKDVYRVDNCHEFLHEQKFWRSPKPIYLKEDESKLLKSIVKKYTREIILNFQKYKEYFERKKK